MKIGLLICLLLILGMNAQNNETNLENNITLNVENNSNTKETLENNNLNLTENKNDNKNEIKNENSNDNKIENLTKTNTSTIEDNVRKLENTEDAQILKNTTSSVESQNIKPTETPTIEKGKSVDFDNNLDKWKDFNLTREVEKLYNSSKYEPTREENIARDAERINQNNHPEVETEEEKHRREWEEQVSNFEASDILTVKLEGKSYFNFYEEVTQVPSHIKVAYFVNGENIPLDFFVYNPRNQIIHRIKNKGQLYYEFVAESSGIYKFVLDNSRWNERKKASFAIHTGNNTDASLELENIDKISTKINFVDQKLDEFKLKEKLLVKKLEGHFEKTEIHNKQIVKYSIIECSTMIIILFVQLYYLKSLLNKIN